MTASELFDTQSTHELMTDSIHVLGLADMRVSEMRDPFDALGERGTLVTVDPDEGVRAYLSALETGSRHVERRDVDAILVYNGSGLIGTVGALLGEYHDVPVLVRLNGDIFRQHRETAREQAGDGEWSSLAAHLPFMLLTRALFGRADGFVPVSAALDDVVHRQTGCPTDRIVSVPNPVSVAEYAPPDEADRTDEIDRTNEAYQTGRADKTDETDRTNDPASPAGGALPPTGDAGRRLLTVTNLNFRGKFEGVKQLVDAAVPVLRRRDDLEYVVAGDGRYHESLQRYLDDRAGDVRGQIRAPGFVDEVERLYWTADVFLYASHIDGYPNVILEAKAAELPIVTNPAYGIAEQIDDGTSGVFVDPGDTAELTDAISSLLDDPAERRRLGRNARRQVESENDPETVAAKLYEAVRCIVDDETTVADAAGEVATERPVSGRAAGGRGGGADGR